jgi:hypothetical protein
MDAVWPLTSHESRQQSAEVARAHNQDRSIFIDLKLLRQKKRYLYASAGKCLPGLQPSESEVKDNKQRSLGETSEVEVNFFSSAKLPFYFPLTPDPGSLRLGRPSFQIMPSIAVAVFLSSLHTS